MFAVTAVTVKLSLTLFLISLLVHDGIGAKFVTTGTPYQANATSKLNTNEKNEMPTSKEINSLQCRKELVKDTFKALLLHKDQPPGDMVLNAFSHEVIRCHSSIVSSRMPYFKLSDSNFIDGLNYENLQALVKFMYWGTLKKWIDNCEVLYRVSLKYGFECLRQTCEEVLMGQIRNFQ